MATLRRTVVCGNTYIGTKLDLDGKIVVGNRIIAREIMKALGFGSPEEVAKTEAAWNAILTIIQTVWTAITTAVQTALTAVSTAVTTAWKRLPQNCPFMIRARRAAWPRLPKPMITASKFSRARPFSSNVIVSQGGYCLIISRLTSSARLNENTDP